MFYLTNLYSVLFSNYIFHLFFNSISGFILQLFSGSDDATVRVWDLNNKKCVATMEKHFSAVVSLAMSEDRSFLLSAGRDKACTLLLFDIVNTNTRRLTCL